MAEATAFYRSQMERVWSIDTVHPYFHSRVAYALPGRFPSIGECEVTAISLLDELHGDFIDPPELLALGDVSTYAIDFDSDPPGVYEQSLIAGHLWVHDGPFGAEFDDVWLHDPTSDQAEYYSLPPTVSGTYRGLRKVGLPNTDQPPVLAYHGSYILTREQLLARLALFPKNRAQARLSNFLDGYERIRNPRRRRVFAAREILGTLAMAAA